VSKERSSRRFRIVEPLTGRFDGVPVTVHDISEKGLQIEHSVTLPLGSKGSLVYTIPGRQRPVEVHGEIRWTKPIRDGSQLYYRSGMMIDRGADALNASIDLLLKKRVARLDRPEEAGQAASGSSASDSHSQVTAAEVPGEIPPRVIAVVNEARDRLAMSFDESVKWYNRARFSLADPAVQREVRDMRCKEDVLAVWEYLGRSVDLHTVFRIFERK
jgi:hypothetical protein